MRKTRIRVGIALTALVAVLASVVLVSAPASAAGVLTVTIQAVDINNNPQTWAGYTGTTPTNLRYNISYSCSVEACDNAEIQLSPSQLDPTYGVYSFLTYLGWTVPVTGATIAGTPTTGMKITLGSLPAGASGSFPVSYTWSGAGSANSSTVRPASFFPNGFPIVFSATATSSTVAGAYTATADPVEWRSTITNPSLALTGTGPTDSGINYTYTVTMASNCLTVRDTAMKGDARYTCAKSYTVVDHLPAEATYVSSTSGGVYDPAAHTVTWTRAPGSGAGEPAIGWARPGVGQNYTIPRTVTVRYDAADFSPSGTDSSYCNFVVPVTNSVEMTMVYLGLSPADNSNVRTRSASYLHNVACIEPFAKAVFNGKSSSYDGPNRLNATLSPVVVQPAPTLNEHYWDISVGNQANVDGVAVVEDADLAIEGTRPYQIRTLTSTGAARSSDSIAWTLNTGVTGTSLGVANAPTGTWFTSMVVTTAPLAGPNLYTTGTSQTTQVTRVAYRVAANAPVTQTRTNTAHATMTYPTEPSLAAIDLGNASHSVQYFAPFGRGTVTKLSSIPTATAGVYNLTIPTSGSVTHYWSLVVRNTGNVPGVAVVDDIGLDSKPVKIVTVSGVPSAGNVSTGATVNYTLNTGVTATVALPFTAPAGTWITAVHVTTPVVEASNALTSQSDTTSLYEIRLGFAVPSTTTPGSWTNTATAVMTYPGMGVANITLDDAVRTINFNAATVDDRARISAFFVGSPVVTGGGSAVPGRDVVYQVRGSSSNVAVGDTFTPQYVFVAPANWKVTPNSASFAAGTVPTGVTYTYKTVVISGISRSAVVATWPAGTTFGANATWPTMTVAAQPTVTAAAGSSGVASTWMGEASHNWNTTEAVFATPAVDAPDFDGDGVTTEGFSGANAAAVGVGSTSQLSVSKQICAPDASQADGCEWVAQPGTIIGVDPAATNIKYRVLITNSGNTPLSNVTAYDVLPFPGDMGTSAATSTSPRGSTFTETVSAVSNLSGVTLSYSTSTNPCRLEVDPAGPAGCDSGWSAPVSGASAIRIQALADIAPGASVSFDYAAAVTGAAASDAIACNSVAAKATQIGLPAEPLAVCATTQEADLELAVPTRLPLQVGRPGVVPYTVTNNGGSQLSGAKVQIAIPAGVEVTDLTPAGWSCTTPSATLAGPITLTCESVDSEGDSRALVKDVPDTLNIPVIASGVSASTCVDGDVSGRMSDPDLANNDASGCFQILAGGALEVDKDDALTAVSIGEQYSYTLTVTNTLVGETLTGITLTDTLPAGLEFVSASDGGALTAGVVTWPIFDLAQSGTTSAGGNTVGATAATTTRTVTVRVLAAATADIVNIATASAADPVDPDVVLSDSDTDTDALRRLTVTKSSDAAASGVRVGDVVEYTIVLTNAGSGDYTSAMPATVRDVLGALTDDATYTAGSAEIAIDGATATALPDPSAGALTWSGPLAAGSSAVITYRVTVGAGGDQSLVNTVFTSGATTCDASTGVADDGAACAGVQSAFGPEVSKSVVSSEQNGDGTWTTVYGIDVVNPNSAGAATYSITDTLRFGTGISVTNASITTAPAGVTVAAWSGSGALVSGASVPASSTHHYEVTVVANVGTVAGTPAAQCVTGAVGGFANTLAFTPVGGDTQNVEACAAPAAPTIDKSAAATTQNSDGTWNTVYTVTVTAPATAPTGGLAYTVDDEFTFPGGVTITGVGVTGPAGAPINSAFNGGTDSSLLSAVDRVGAGATRTFTVTVTTSVPAGSVTAGALACAPAGSGGYANSAALFSGSSSTALDAADACAAVVAKPTPVVGKTVTSTSIDAGSGDWTIVYDIAVTNPSTLYSTDYNLSDELQFGDGLTVVSATAASIATVVPAGWNGTSSPSLATGVALPASAVHHYTVTVVAAPPVITTSNEAAMDCRIDAGETGTGFRNVATVTSGLVDAFAVGCESATDPSVVKTTVGSPVQDPATGFWSLEYQITVTNRATSTVVGGIPYTVVDTFNLPAGTNVTDIDVTAPAGAVVDPLFDGAGNSTLATSTIGAAASETVPLTQVYNVTITFTVPGGLTAAQRECDVAQRSGGLGNQVEIQVGPRVTADVACADAPETPIAGVGKTVLSQTQNLDGTWLVLYRVTVANPSPAIATTYDLDDEFALGGGMSVVSASITAQPAGVTVNHAGWDGSTDTTIAEDVLLGAGALHTYTVRAVLDAGTVRGTDAAGDCVLDAGESMTGFGNTAVVGSGITQRTATACATAFDPGVSKTVNGLPVRNSDGSWTVRYVITVANPSATVGLLYELTDQLDFPAGTVINAAAVNERSGGPAASTTWDGSTDLVVVPVGTALAPGALHVFDVVVDATLPSGQASVVGGFVNRATVGSGTGGVITTSEVAAADIAVPALEVTKSVSAPTVPEIGDMITYTVTIENTGDGPFTLAYPAEVWDDLAGVLDDATLVALPTPTVGAVSSIGDRLRWSGALAMGAAVDLVYSVQVTALGDLFLDNVAFAADTPGGSPTTPSVGACTTEDCALTSTPLPSFQIAKSASTAVVQNGDVIVYTVAYTNTGGIDMTLTTPATFTDDLIDVLDDANVVAAPTASSGVVAITGSVLTWSGALAAGASVTVQYSVVVDELLSGDDILTNVATTDDRFGTAWLSGTCPGGTASCAPPARDAVHVAAVRSLAYSKTVDLTIASVGDTVNYTVLLENLGQADYTLADPAIVTDYMADVLDDATYKNDAVVSAGTVAYAAPTLTWTTPVAAGDAEAMTYSVVVTGAGNRSLVNVVAIDGVLPAGGVDACDADPGANGDTSCSTTTTVMRLAFTGLDGITTSMVAGLLLLGFGGVATILSRRRRRGIHRA